MNAYDPPLVTLLWLLDVSIGVALILAAGVAGLFLYRAIQRHRPDEGNPTDTNSEETADNE